MKSKKLNKTSVLLQIFICGAMFLLPLMFTAPDEDITLTSYLRKCVWPAIMLIVFYANYLWLAPSYLIHNKNRNKFWIINITIICLLSLALGWINNYNHKEMMKVELAMHNKDMHKFKDNKKFIIFGYFRDFYNLSLAAVIAYSMIMSRNLIISENARKEAEAARMDAELSNLRYQINPHFLLNTLNNIYALISFNTNKAQTSILELSKMMRYMLYDNQQKLTNLKNETNFIHNYINLMKIRLTPNIKVEEHINIPEPCTIQIAPLIFISLIENAFKHGISPTEPSFINVRIDANNERIICDIKNSNFPKNEQDRSGHGIGLEQVQKRLNLSYPGKYEWKNNIDKQENIYQSTIIIYDTKLCNS
jgi:two-component sensor histidine kinase